MGWGEKESGLVEVAVSGFSPFSPLSAGGEVLGM